MVMRGAMNDILTSGEGGKNSQTQVVQRAGLFVYYEQSKQKKDY